MNKAKLACGNESWYEMLFTSNPLPMLIYDPATQGIVAVNRSAITHYGYEASEWARMKVSDLCQHPNLAGVRAQVEALPNNSTSFAVLSRHLKKNGELIDVRLNRHVLPVGRKGMVLLIVHDVSAECQLEATLRTVTLELDRAQHIARLGSWTRDFATETDRWSDQAYRNFGVPQGSPASYPAFLRTVHPGDRQRVDEVVSTAVATRQPFAFEHRVVWPDGSVHALREQGIVIHDLGGRPSQLVGTSLDITEQHRTETALRQTQKDFKNAQRIAGLGTWALELAGGRFKSWSDETFRIFGYPPAELPTPDEILEERVHRDDRARVRQACRYAEDTSAAPCDIEFRVQHPERGERIVHCVADLVADQDGMDRRLVGFAQDVTEARRAEEQIRYLAFHDKTTRLPNRASLERFLDDALVPGRPRRALGLLVIYLTRFKEINFTLSHNEGDQLLRAVGRRIETALGPKGFVARIGNSQFAVVLNEADGALATAAARDMLEALQTPFLIAGISYGLGAHMGIALAPAHGNDSATVLRKAEVALFQAKQTGRACLMYDAHLDPYNPQRLALIGEFRKSLRAGELRLYCQPKADISTGTIIGAEALVRWEHPVFGLIPPDQFIPLIEPTELIQPLTQFMLDAAIRQSLAWRADGVMLPIAVNLSPRNLIDPGLVQYLHDTLAAHGVEPDCLGLEITEGSLLADPQSSIKELHRLSAMGCRLYIDDFGTGYSSLSYLMRLPVHVIKIDHSFTMHMIGDEKTATIVRSTIDLAHNLGMKVVAEGAANKAIWDALGQLGCDEAQGYYISPALPAGDFLPWMRSSGFGVASPGSAI